MNVDSASFNYISICAGAGGLDLGIRAAIPSARCVALVEIEAFACAVLEARMESGDLDACPIWTDCRTFPGRKFRGLVDLVTGGTPCQDLSLAGKRAGIHGKKSGLFWAFIEVVEQVQPEFVLWENVGGARSALPVVFDALESRGYTGAAVALRASDVGASHGRERIFLFAHGHGREGERRGGLLDRERAPLGHDADGCGGAAVADPNSRQSGVESGRRNGSSGSGTAEPGNAGLGVANAVELGVLGRTAGAGEAPGGGSCAEAPGPGVDVADAPSERWRQGRAEPGAQGETGADGSSETMGDSAIEGREGRTGPGIQCGLTDRRGVVGVPFPPGPGDSDRWRDYSERYGITPAVPRLRRGVDGAARRLDALWAHRLRALGNGVVPSQAEAAIRFLFDGLGASP